MGPARARLLCIDDSLEVREFLQLVLEDAGYQVRVAADGHEGLEVTRSFQPDVIITDVSMPRMDGLEFLVRLRSDFAPPLPPVVACSGFDATAEEALRLGALRFVAKPVEPAAILRIVEEALHGVKAGEEELAHERAFVQAARARAAAAATRMLTGVDLQSPQVTSLITRFVQWVSDYFGYSPAAVTFVQGAGNLLVAAVSQGCPVRAGMAYTGQALYSTGVLASGASLVIPNASSTLRSIGDPRAANLGVRFVVAVPLVFEKVPIGALCLIDREPHVFEVEDLLVLEQIGRQAGTNVRKVARRIGEEVPIGESIGLVPSAAFARLLAAELSALHRESGGLDLLLVEIDPAGFRPSLLPELIERLEARSRLGACRGEGTSLAIFKRDSDPAVASGVISDVLMGLSAGGSVRAAGWISVVDDGLPPIPDQVLMQLAREAVQQSRSARPHRAEHIVLRREAGPILQVTAEAVPSPPG